MLTPTQTSPTPAPSPSPSATTATAPHHDTNIPGESSIDNVPDEEEPMERYHIEIPPLPGTASSQALRVKNLMLQDIIRDQTSYSGHNIFTF